MQELDIKLPDVGEGVTEAELVEWHVKPGDLVREDDILAAVMTDKATVEIPSLYDGKVTWTGGEIGDTVAVGSVLVRIETEGEAVPDVFEQAAPVVEPAPEPVVEKAVAPVAEPEPQTEAAPVVIPQVVAPRVEHADVLASPAVRKRARDAGIDLRQVRGTGPGGRIEHGDLDALFQSAQAPAAPVSTPARKPDMEEIKVVGLRRKIADRMSLANERIPHITVVEEVDVTGVEDLRATMNRDRGDKPKLTMLPFICAALARAVQDHPEMNAHFDDNAGVIRRHRAVHAGIATMTDGGLIVPVLRDAETRGLFDTAGEIARLSEAARSGKAVREELTGSTITITSLGPLGAIVTTPIINHPEVAIVGINKMAVRPHWDGTQFVPRKMMNISCSFDHRVIDGYDAAVFVQRLKSLLETPALIFVEE